MRVVPGDHPIAKVNLVRMTPLTRCVSTISVFDISYFPSQPPQTYERLIRQPGLHCLIGRTVDEQHSRLGSIQIKEW